MMAQEKSKMDWMFFQNGKTVFQDIEANCSFFSDIAHSLCLYDMTNQTDQSGDIRNSPIPGIS